MFRQERGYQATTPRQLRSSHQHKQLELELCQTCAYEEPSFIHGLLLLLSRNLVSHHEQSAPRSSVSGLQDLENHNNPGIQQPIMRYGDWDILLFPGSSKVPMKEFKVACHVVHDSGMESRYAIPFALTTHYLLLMISLEFTHNQGSFGLPTVCCFVPSLDAGAPFQISVHCWGLPSISQFTKSYTKHVEDVNFEARLLIDGRLVAYAFPLLSPPSPFANKLPVLRRSSARATGRTSLRTASVRWCLLI